MDNFPVKNEHLHIADKLWGYEVWIKNDEDYCVKELHLNEGFESSLHYHKLKFETFYVSCGILRVEIVQDGVSKIYTLGAGEWLNIDAYVKHRLSSIARETVIIECSTQHFENDSYRDEESRQVES